MPQKLEQCQEMDNFIIGFGYIPPSIPGILLYHSLEFSVLMDGGIYPLLKKNINKNSHETPALKKASLCFSYVPISYFLLNYLRLVL